MVERQGIIEVKRVLGWREADADGLRAVRVKGTDGEKYVLYEGDIPLEKLPGELREILQGEPVENSPTLQALRLRDFRRQVVLLNIRPGTKLEFVRGGIRISGQELHQWGEVYEWKVGRKAKKKLPRL